MRAPVYLDHNATTPLDPRVREAMLPWLDARPANASSVHRRGQEAREAVEEARAAVAGLVGARPPEVVFTASGTEANNAVVFSLARAVRAGTLVLSAFEHPSIRAAADALVARGFESVAVAPRPDGVVDAERFLAALAPDTFLACLMLANNEVGTVQPVAQVARGCRRAGVPLLVDAVQAVGKIGVDVEALDCDYLTLGAHKFGGPLGAAALWIRPGARFEPLLVGGGQERRRRASTENVPALVGLGLAAAVAGAELAGRGRRLAALRDRFETGVAGIPGASVHGAGAPRLPNTSNVAFPGAAAESLVVRLDLAGYAVSAGSACSSGRVEPSVALAAMGVPRDKALASLRVTVGIDNTEAEVDGFLEVLAREVEALRRLTPVAR